MAVFEDKPPVIHGKPEEKLANLLAADTGAKIDPKLLRLFLIANWRRVAVLAHAIHDANVNLEVK